MADNITVDKTTYIICYNLEIHILHYVVLEPGQLLSTGQPQVELHDTEEEAIIRMIELGFDPADYIEGYEPDEIEEPDEYIGG